MDYLESIKRSLMEAIESNEKEIRNAQDRIEEYNRTIEDRQNCIQALKENLDRYEQMRYEQIN